MNTVMNVTAPLAHLNLFKVDPGNIGSHFVIIRYRRKTWLKNLLIKTK